MNLFNKLYTHPFHRLLWLISVRLICSCLLFRILVQFKLFSSRVYSSFMISNWLIPNWRKRVWKENRVRETWRRDGKRSESEPRSAWNWAMNLSILFSALDLLLCKLFSFSLKERRTSHFPSSFFSSFFSPFQLSSPLIPVFHYFLANQEYTWEEDPQTQFCELAHAITKWVKK